MSASKVRLIYTPMQVRDLEFNQVFSMICDGKTRLGCDKDSRCHIQLCGDDKARMAGKKFSDKIKFEGLDVMDPARLEYEKLVNAGVEIWRSATYENCRAISISIKAVD